jgi:hypothetical protein
VTTQNITTTVEICANAFWPDEANLATFAEAADQAVKTDRMKQPDRTLENDTEYAALYFVS